jgi:hypothetical protein
MPSRLTTKASRDTDWLRAWLAEYVKPAGPTAAPEPRHPFDLDAAAAAKAAAGAAAGGEEAGAEAVDLELEAVRLARLADLHAGIAGVAIRKALAGTGYTSLLDWILDRLAEPREG